MAQPAPETYNFARGSDGRFYQLPADPKAAMSYGRSRVPGFDGKMVLAASFADAKRMLAPPLPLESRLLNAAGNTSPLIGGAELAYGAAIEGMELLGDMAGTVARVIPETVTFWRTGSAEKAAAAGTKFAESVGSSVAAAYQHLVPAGVPRVEAGRLGARGVALVAGAPAALVGAGLNAAGRALGLGPGTRQVVGDYVNLAAWGVGGVGAAKAVNSMRAVLRDAPDVSASIEEHAAFLRKSPDHQFDPQKITDPMSAYDALQVAKGVAGADAVALAHIERRIPDAPADDWRAIDEYLDDPASVKLTPAQQELHDKYVSPLLDLHARFYQALRAERDPEIDPNAPIEEPGVPRLVLDRPNLLTNLMQTARRKGDPGAGVRESSTSKSAESIKPRHIFAARDAQGNRILVEPDHERGGFKNATTGEHLGEGHIRSANSELERRAAPVRRRLRAAEGALRAVQASIARVPELRGRLNDTIGRQQELIDTGALYRGQANMEQALADLDTQIRALRPVAGRGSKVESLLEQTTQRRLALADTLRFVRELHQNVDPAIADSVVRDTGLEGVDVSDVQAAKNAEAAVERVLRRVRQPSAAVAHLARLERRAAELRPKVVHGGEAIRQAYRDLRSQAQVLRTALRTYNPALRLEQELKDRVARWQDELARVETSVPQGDRVLTLSGGRTFALSQATKSEIEANTGIRYLRNPAAALILRTKQLSEALWWSRITRALAESPISRLSEGGQKLFYSKEDLQRGAKPPGYFRTSRLRALDGAMMDPRFAEVFDEFAADPRNSAWATLGQASLNLMFINPLPHFYNEMNVFLTARGLWDNLKTVGWPPAAARFAHTLNRAMDDVLHGRPLYLEAKRLGAEFRDTPYLLRQAQRRYLMPIFQRLMSEPEFAEATRWVRGPRAAATKVWEATQRMLWASGDVMMMHFIREQMDKGLTLPQAVARANDAMLTYRLPPRLLGSRFARELLSDNMFSVFFRYHYNLMRNMARMLYRSVIGDPKMPPGDRALAFSQLAYLMADATVGFRLRQALVQAALTNPNASNRESGYQGFIDHFRKVLTGEATPQSLIVTGSPALSAGEAIVFNRNAYTGEELIPWQTAGMFPWQAAKDTARAVTSFVPAVNELRYGLLGELFGIRDPSREEVERRKRAQLAIERRRILREAIRAKGRQR